MRQDTDKAREEFHGESNLGESHGLFPYSNVNDNMSMRINSRNHGFNLSAMMCFLDCLVI